MSERLFKFGVSLTVGRPKKRDDGTLDFFGPLEEQVEITGLRVIGEIAKSLDETPNTCNLVIYNLAPGTRGLFAKLPLHVRVDVGFDGRLERIFAGDMIWSESVPSRADWETRVQVSDGARAYAYGRVNRSFAPGVTLRDALADVAAGLGLRLPPLEGPEFASQYAHGLSLNGSARRAMSRILAPHGMDWSIQDGRLQILRKGESRTNDPILISSSTGLIGSPEFGSPPQPDVTPSGKRRKKVKPPTLRVACLIRPGLTPGGRVEVQSREHKGIFRLDRLRSRFDNFGGERRSDLEVVRA